LGAGREPSGSYGRWAFSEFTEIYQIASDFEAKVKIFQPIGSSAWRTPRRTTSSSSTQKGTSRSRAANAGQRLDELGAVDRLYQIVRSEFDDLLGMSSDYILRT
jgi:hypothetical protein